MTTDITRLARTGGKNVKMAKIFPITEMIDGLPCLPVPIEEVWSQCVRGGSLEVHTPLEYITNQQRKWWKGVLLPALAKDNGESVHQHETRLKLTVMPDEFQPFYITVLNQIFPIIPSITILGKKKMNIMIEGSVAQCHENGFMWVTLPDKDLRRY